MESHGYFDAWAYASFPVHSSALNLCQSLAHTRLAHLRHALALLPSTVYAQHIQDGIAGLQAAHAQGGSFYKGIHVHSKCSYFNGFLWGIKVLFWQGPVPQTKDKTFQM